MALQWDAKTKFRTLMCSTICWGLFVIIAASCIMAGAYQAVNLSWVDCYYGGVSSSQNYGETGSGVASRSCDFLSSYISCDDMMENVWNNASKKGAGYLEHSQLRDFQMSQCIADKVPVYWQAAWPTTFLFLLAFAFPAATIIWGHRAIVALTPLAVLVFVLVINLEGPGKIDGVDGLMYWCEGLSDAVYGPCQHDVAAAGADAARVLSAGSSSFGGQPTACYTPAINSDEWDKEIWDYKAPGTSCACDQAGNNEDIFFMSLKHHVELLDAGRWMSILALLVLFGLIQYEALVWLMFPSDNPISTGGGGGGRSNSGGSYDEEEVSTSPTMRSSLAKPSGSSSYQAMG